MKRRITRAILLLMLPCLVACSSAGNPSSDRHTQASGTVTEPETESGTEEPSVTTSGKENWPESVAAQAPDSEKNTQEVVYKSVNGIDLEMTIYQPTNRVYEKTPVFYMIVGGGWEAIDRSAMVLFCKDTILSLRKQGFAVVNIDYRVREQVDGMDDIVSDCMDGIRYLTYYADVLGIDAEKIFTCGHSAGGHLALTVALADQEKFLCDSEFAGVTYQVSGVVGLAAPSMMRTYNGKHILHYHYPVLTALMGEDETKDIWGDVDPYHLISKICRRFFCSTGQQTIWYILIPPSCSMNRLCQKARM